MTAHKISNQKSGRFGRFFVLEPGHVSRAEEIGFRFSKERFGRLDPVEIDSDFQGDRLDVVVKRNAALSNGSRGEDASPAMEG
ncbi:hypothetical protein ABVB72_13420 [Rhizobium nepotum]|uniref:hypothetical protein n=1 Tax=Rhizobium nepotum TaxID=1035271 RepID=UPI00336A07F9